MKKICVIIPVFNALKEVKACIKSVLKNFDFNLGEVLIADDCSDKRTEKFLKKITTQNKNKLKLFRNEINLGYLKNCNNAVTKTDAEIVVLLNSDCEIPANFTEKIIRCFDFCTDIVAASPIASNSATYFIPQILPLCTMNFILSQKKPVYPEITNSEGFCFCIRKSFIDKYGLFDEIYDKGYYEEVDFCFMAKMKKKKCVLIDDLYVKHKRNRSFGQKREELMIRNQKIFYSKWKKALNPNLICFLPIAFEEIIAERFGRLKFIPLILIKIHNIFTKASRVNTIKNLFKHFQKHTTNTKVIYTCISGDCDLMPVIQTYYAKDWRYVCFTNNRKLLLYKKIGMWEIKKMQFEKLDSTKNACWHKLHPDILFPDSLESIWIDANLDILTDKLFKTLKVQNSEILIPEHHLRNCIFDEIEAVKQSNKEEPQALQKIRNYLAEHGMPVNYGLNETNIIYRKHNNPQVKTLMQKWWSVVECYSKLDQLSLSYVLWKNNINPEDISIANARIDRANFKIYSHNPAKSSLCGKVLKLIFG